MFFIPTGTSERVARRRFPIVTVLLLFINIAVFLYEVSVLHGSGEAGLNAFLNQYAVTPSDVTDGTPLELGLLTSMFLHGSLLHVVGNMIFLLPFGDNVEDRLGHAKFLIFYLLTGVAASLGYVAFNAGSDIPLLGASGAVAGILAGYLTLHFTGFVRGFFVFIIIPFRVQLPAVIFIGYWFLLQLLSSTATLGEQSATGGVAFLAHVAGFISGLILAPLLAAGQSKAEPDI
jgi:membrane associated rhomboid family serine protease